MGNTRDVYEDLIKGLLKGLADPAVPDKTAGPESGSGQMKHQSLLVLLCGGLTGSEEAGKQLRWLKEQGYRMEVMFTEAGKNILGARWLKDNRLEDLPVLDRTADGFVALSNCNAVVVPVMTVNTASKVLNGIADNAVTTVIMHALLQGKPVIAAQNACDVANLAQVRNMKEPLYYATLAANIECLRQYGIEMIPVSDTGKRVEEIFDPSRLPRTAIHTENGNSGDTAVKAPEKSETVYVFTGRVLSAADVLSCRADVIRIPKKAIVTPAAADRARERKIRIAAE